jgi:Leucine-rich repeat (LRR) protein
VLTLAGAPVADLSPLAGLARLKELWLNDTKVADLSPLMKLPALELLSVQGAPVPEAQVKELQRRHPKLEVAE